MTIATIFNSTSIAIKATKPPLTPVLPSKVSTIALDNEIIESSSTKKLFLISDIAKSNNIILHVQLPATCLSKFPNQPSSLPRFLMLDNLIKIGDVGEEKREEGKQAVFKSLYKTFKEIWSDKVEKILEMKLTVMSSSPSKKKEVHQV